MSKPVNSRDIYADEVLDYFGKCPRCGYPAQATAVTRVFIGRRETTVTVTCGLPCGWTDSA